MKKIQMVIKKAIQDLILASLVALGVAFIVERASDKIKEINLASAPLPPLSVDEIIESEARINRVSPAIVRGIITQESKWNEEAASSKGAIGLMQLTIPTAKAHCGLSDPELIKDPKINIQCGTKIFADYLKGRRNNVELALVEYNGGDKCVKSRRCKESENFWKSVINHSVLVTKSPILYFEEA